MGARRICRKTKTLNAYYFTDVSFYQTKHCPWYSFISARTSHAWYNLWSVGKCKDRIEQCMQATYSKPILAMAILSLSFNVVLDWYLFWNLLTNPGGKWTLTLPLIVNWSRCYNCISFCFVCAILIQSHNHFFHVLYYVCSGALGKIRFC